MTSDNEQEEAEHINFTKGLKIKNSSKENKKGL